MAEQSKKSDAVTLKTKISSILREDFVLRDEYATAHATLEDALTHVLGVGPHDSFNYGGDGYSLKDAVRSMRHLSMTAELREKHQYLNMGYMVIQHVIETLTGKPIQECHHKYIWDPLGMKSTYIRLKDAEASPQVLADGYAWDPVMQRLDDAEHVNDYPLVGGGGIITSIKDLTTYLNATVHKILPLDFFWQEELFKPRVVAGSAWYKGSSTNLYCLGWGTFHYRGQTVVMHNGAIDGFNSVLLFLPDMKWGVATLANANPNGMNAIEVLVQRLLDDRLSIPHVDREDKLSKQLHKLANSIEDPVGTRRRLYPSIPEPPLPLPLPLEKYAGTYYNAGYRSITLKTACPLRDTPMRGGTTKVLHADMHRLIEYTLDFEHISGDYFIAWADSANPRVTSRDGFRAVFRLESNGNVEQLGISFSPMSSGTDDPMMVWFTRLPASGEQVSS